MQSKKRFTEINIWEADWFMELKPYQKLMWFYINDRCDNIGVWNINLRLAAFHLEISEEIETFWDEFVEAVNNSDERIRELKQGTWILLGFVEFQYCKKNPLSNKSIPHKTYIDLMHKRDLWEWFCINHPEVMPPEDLEQHNSLYPSPTLAPRVNRRAKDKEEEKEPDKEVDTEEDKALTGIRPKGEDSLSFEKNSIYKRLSINGE